MRVNNGGKLLLTDGGGSNQLIIGGGTPSATALILMSGSTLEVTLGSASHVVNAFGAVYGVIDVKSGATMVVNNGALQIDQYSDGATYGMKFDGVHLTAGMTSLDAGIYKISRTLDLNSNVGPNKFSTIGANATVRFVGTNAVFDAVGTFTTVNGRLGLEAGRTNRVTTAAAVTVAGTGKLLVGLNAPDTVDPALTTNACLKVGTSVTLSDGAGIEVVDSGGVTQGEYVIVSAPTVSAPGTHSVTFPEGMPTGVHRAKVQVRGGNKLILMLRGAGGTVFIFK
jgi:hypothetical protein